MNNNDNDNYFELYDKIIYNIHQNDLMDLYLIFNEDPFINFIDYNKLIELYGLNYLKTEETIKLVRSKIGIYTDDNTINEILKNFSGLISLQNDEIIKLYEKEIITKEEMKETIRSKLKLKNIEFENINPIKKYKYENPEEIE